MADSAPVLITSLGLMGASLAAALSKRGRSVLLHHRRPEVAERAAELGYGRAVRDPVAAMADCGVAVVCTPVGCIPGLVRELTAGDGDAVITDVGSTKGALCSELADLAGSGRYVGSHPMCGSHLTGLENADPDLYEGALCVVTPLPESPEQAVARVETLWSGVGGRLWRCSPGAHDDAVAEASHLPHILSAATARLLGDNGLPLAATGFRDTSRVAAGAPGLWRDILMENREAVRRELGRAKDLLSELDRALDAGDGAAVEAWLSRAAERRRAFDERD